MRIWRVGDRLTHRYNPELGPGRVVGLEERIVVVEFPDSSTTLRLSTDSDALVPLVLAPGSRARLEGAEEVVEIAEVLDDGACRLADGRVVRAASLWPLPAADSPLDRLAEGRIDSVDDFANRLDALHLLSVREADGLGSFLGGRIHLFPHQLHAAERAARSDPVRWLLADEVGLGKTVEACLIMNRLLHTGRADRTLVVAPHTLTVQWLGELWRKYHQVFVLIDEQRLADVTRDHGAGFNPFDVYRRAIVALETLVDQPGLARQAVDAAPDLLVVDEAHHLQRPAGHPGNPPYRTIAPIAALGRHLLLLTATPMEDDAHGFFRLLQLLRPDEFPEDDFEQRLAERRPLPACTSATRRADIGGLPPRAPAPVDIEPSRSWSATQELELRLRALPAEGPGARKHKSRLLERALSSPATIESLLGADDRDLRRLARRAAAEDPRLDWLAARVRRWKEAGDKTLVFVAEREALETLRPELERTGRVRVGIFHEDLSPARRDIEVAQFRLPGGPSLLVSTECGGEGRNFEFCRRLVLFDLPWNPATIEQRIGRLDRIGRTSPTEIVYFRRPSGLVAALTRLYEDIGLFRQPLGGLDRELGHVADAVRDAALAPEESLDSDTFAGVVAEARDASRRVREAAYHELHRDAYDATMAEAILQRVPGDLDQLTEEVVTQGCERLGFAVESQRGQATYSIELGSGALVDQLPGVPGGSSFLGTFARDEAVDNESIDYFASGHSLVEGLLAELTDGPRGRTALLEQVADPGAEGGFGLLALFRESTGFEAIAVDENGDRRPDWAERLTRRPLRTRRVEPADWTSHASWAAAIRRLAERLGRKDRPVAAAAFRILPASPQARARR